MATKAAEAIRRERERRELLARLDALIDKIDIVYDYVQAQGAAESAPDRTASKTTRKAKST